MAMTHDAAIHPPMLTLVNSSCGSRESAAVLGCLFSLRWMLIRDHRRVFMFLHASVAHTEASCVLRSDDTEAD